MVAGFGHQLSERDLLLGQANPPGAGEIDNVDANPDIVPTRIEGDAGRRAGDFRVVLQELYSLLRQLVEVRGRCAAQFTAAVDTELGIADIVSYYLDDVWFLAELFLQFGQLGLNNLFVRLPLLAKLLFQLIIFCVLLNRPGAER
jgi:hypothetical protein